MKLEFTQDANADLDGIWTYSLGVWGAVTAADYLDRIADSTEALARGDLSGRAADAVRPGLRRLVVGSHVIWFRIVEDTLTVVRVLHQSRDAGRWVG